MFSSVAGRTRDHQIFYDSGNSHCLYRTGTPADLWGCMMRRGPHNLGVVGGITHQGGDSWACQPKTTSGKREILIGIEVPQITSEFPVIDLTEATADLKSSKPHDPELQALRVPAQVGGQVDILLGIQYASHFPTLVHSLESGLGIYKVKLTPSSSEYTAAIAGPHHSFNLILEQVGDMVTMLTAFREGIDRWKTHGPPPPQHLPLTTEEMHLAISLNQEKTPVLKHLKDRNDLLDAKCSDDDLPSHICAPTQTNPGEDPCHVLKRTLCPNTIQPSEPENDTLCFDLKAVAQTPPYAPLCIRAEAYRIYAEAYTKEFDPNLSEPETYEADLDNLISIKYRCPKYRNCADCRDPITTERASLREEAEEIQIRDSVTLDHENKRFTCLLPLRGWPEEYLSTNKDQARKILAKQVSLYHQEEDTKAMITKAVNKLSTNGHDTRPLPPQDDPSRSAQIEARARHSKYIVSPKAKASVTPDLPANFKAILSTPKPLFESILRLTNDDIQQGLMYFYQKATTKVDTFVSADRISKHMYHRSRIDDGQRGSRTTGGDHHELAVQGINLYLPVVDRWPPLAYSLDDWIHEFVSNHAGFETSRRHSLDYCFIIHGHSLFEELARACVLCAKLSSRFIQATPGPRNPNSYFIAMGIVDSVDIGRDGLIRHVAVKYFNASDPNTPQTSDRAVRSLVRLSNMDELSWTQDTDLPIAPDALVTNQPPEPTSLSRDRPLIPNPAPDDMPDVLLDAGTRDELNHQQDTSLSHILTLGTLPLSVGQQPL